MKDLKVEMIDGLMILEWGSALKNVKITGDTTSANPEWQQFPDAIKKIIEEERYLTEQVFNTNKSALFWKIILLQRAIY